MAKKSKTPVYDITKVGPRRFNELQEQNLAMQGMQMPDLADVFPEGNFQKRSYGVTTHNPLQNATQDVYSPLYDQKGGYWGGSIHDEEIASGSDWEHLSDIRANNQSGLEKLLNGTIKFGTTAATTFLDSTVGSLWGLGAGVVNLVDNDPNTGFWQGMWDNAVNRAMSNAQDAMEKIAPNYYTEAELNNPWYQNVFTANFLADKVLKNAGFTVGALASMAVPGVGLLGAGANAAVQGLGKVIQASKLIKTGAQGAKVLGAAKRAGGVAEKLVNSFISANGEAAIEAINAVKANEESLTQNINQWAADAQQRALQEYYRTGDSQAYNAALQEITTAQEAALQEAANTARGLGNSVYFGNVVLLMLTNNLEFGKYIKGGWNPQKGIKNFDYLSGTTRLTDEAAFGRAIAEGTGKLAVPETIGKRSAGRIIGGSLARAGEEGFEEGAQNLISDSGQMQQQARLNKWAKEKYADSSLLAARINPEVNDELVDRMKAIGEAWTQNFGSGFDAPGWEEVFLGALTGGLGTVSVHTDPVTKKWNVWQGGFIEEIRKPKEELQQAEQIVEKFNDYVQRPEFRDKVRHAIASVGLAETMDDALLKDDILRFKNAELMSLANDALFFRNYEGLGAFKGFYERMAESVTDEDIASVRASLRQVATGKSWLDTKTDTELRTLLQEKASSTLDKINNVLDNADVHELRYGDTFRKLDEEKGTSYYGMMLGEITAKAALIDDLHRRKAELEAERDKVSPLTAAVKGESYTKQIKQIDDKIAELESQYEDWIKNPEHLHKSIEDRQELLEKYEIGKDADKARERLKTAETIQDVADYYFSTNPAFRQKAFDQATREAEGPVKDLLTSFRPFLAVINSLNNLIERQARDAAADLYDEWASYDDDVDQNIKDSTLNMAEAQRTQYEYALKREVQEIVDSFVEDKNVSYTKETLEQALRERAAYLLTDEEINSNPSTRAAASYLAQELNGLAHSVKTLSDVYKEAEEFREAKREEETEAKKEEEPKEEAPKPAEPRTPIFFVGATGSGEEVLDIPEPEELEEENPEESAEEESPEENEPEETRRSSLIPIPTEGKSEEEIDQAEDILNSGDETTLPPNANTETPAEFIPFNEDQQTKISFRGHAYHRYKTSAIRKGEGVEEPLSGSYYKLLAAKGFDIDFIQNYFLQQMRNRYPEGRLPVQYMIMHGKKRGNVTGMLAGGKSSLHIFLVTPYNDNISDIIQRGDNRVSGNIIQSQGREYVVVGTLGYSSNASSLSQQFKRIEAILKEDDKNLQKAGTPEEFVVHNGEEDGVSNFIYAQSPGYVIRRNSGESQETPADMSLKTLLDTANPRNLKFRDLRWLILEGKNPEILHEENRKWINFKKGEQIRRPEIERYPGKLYLFLQAADGSFIPQYVTPIRFRNLSEANGKIWDNITSAVRNIAKGKTPEERTAAFGRLRDLFVFNSNLGGGGTNIFYNSETDIVNYAVADLVRRGERDSIDFSQNLSEDEIYDRLMTMLADTNPRLRINAKTLAENPGYYINNGAIRVNLRSLGLVDSRSYAYPINADNTPALDFTATTNANTSPRIETQRVVYFNDAQYKIVQEDTGIRVLDANGAQITDETLLREMRDTMLILDYSILPTTLTPVGVPNGKRIDYYIGQLTDNNEDTFVYVRKGSGSFRRLYGADLQTFRSRLNYSQKEEARQAAVTEALGQPIETPSLDSQLDIYENPPFDADNMPAQTQQKSEEPISKEIKNSIFVNEIRLDIDSYGRLLEIGQNSGLDWDDNTDFAIMENDLLKGKYGELYLKVHDTDSLQEYLNTIEECGI